MPGTWVGKLCLVVVARDCRRTCAPARPRAPCTPCPCTLCLSRCCAAVQALADVTGAEDEEEEAGRLAALDDEPGAGQKAGSRSSPAGKATPATAPAPAAGPVREAASASAKPSQPAGRSSGGGASAAFIMTAPPSTNSPPPEKEVDEALETGLQASRATVPFFGGGGQEGGASKALCAVAAWGPGMWVGSGHLPGTGRGRPACRRRCWLWALSCCRRTCCTHGWVVACRFATRTTACVCPWWVPPAQLTSLKHPTG